MTAEHFDNTLRAWQRRQPFRPFAVRFMSGEQVSVDHPEAIVIRGGVAVCLSPSGSPTLFDHDSVSEVTGQTGQRSA